MEEVKLKGSIFLSVKELMTLTGRDLTSESQYESARKEHKAIRECISIKKKKLTVKEYCSHEMISENEIILFLNQNR